MPRRGSSGPGGYSDIFSYDGSYFPPSRPREVKGGIKAHSQSGGFGASWWAQRWIAVLESFELGTRLSRGRSYARKGQVLDIAIEPGAITARVQGSRPWPYDVRINVTTLAREAWERVAEVIGGQALFAAKLLNGEMPHDIEDAFRAARVSLFPERMDDLDTSCSCPDWSNPC
ncbi:MAG: SWIM zinc finger family protein, partial [Ktedonobacterales bacterium]